MQSATEPFATLPDELLIKILARISPRKAIAVSRTCARFRRVVSSAAFWSSIGLPLGAGFSQEENKTILRKLEDNDDADNLACLPFFSEKDQERAEERDLRRLRLFSKADAMYFGVKYPYDRMRRVVQERAALLHKWTAPHICLRADVEALPPLHNLLELTIAFPSFASLLAAVASTPMLERLVARFPPASGLQPQASPLVSAQAALLESAVPPHQQHDLTTVSIMSRLGAGGDGRPLEELGFDAALLAARCRHLRALAIEFPSLSPRAAPATATRETFGGLAGLAAFGELALENVGLEDGALDAWGALGLRALALTSHVHHLPSLALAGPHHHALQRLSVAVSDPQATAACLSVSCTACPALREVSISSAGSGAGAGAMLRAAACPRLEAVKVAGREAGLLLHGDPAAACPALARLEFARAPGSRGVDVVGLHAVLASCPRLSVLAIEAASTADASLRVAHAALRELRLGIAEVRVPPTWHVEPEAAAAFTTPLKRAPPEGVRPGPFSPTSPCTPCQRGPDPASPTSPHTPDVPIPRSVPYPVVSVHCPGLRSLRYRGPAPPPRPVLALSESTCASLEALHIHSTPESNTAAWLTGIVRLAPRLTALTAERMLGGGAVELPSASLRQVQLLKPKLAPLAPAPWGCGGGLALESLVLHKPVGLTDAALAALVAHLPRLSSLEVERATELREPRLEPACPAGLARLLLVDCPALRSLSLPHGPCPDALELLECPRLARAEAGGCLYTPRPAGAAWLRVFGGHQSALEPRGGLGEGMRGLALTGGDEDGGDSGGEGSPPN